MDSPSDYIERLRPAGGKRSGKRDLVVSVFLRQEGHLSADDLVDLMRREDHKTSRATVYRTLKILVEADVICRVLLEDGDLHYQLSHQGHHHHLLCVHCGSSQDLTGCDIEDVLVTTSARHGFELSGHWLEVYGRCRDCIETEPVAV
jgi:Fur family ferric uptake transcriptional regulator